MDPFFEDEKDAKPKIGDERKEDVSSKKQKEV
jgi:hypothetical protein